MATLRVLLVVAVVCVSMVECGVKDKTPECKQCNWKLTVKTRGNKKSGTDCSVQVRVYFEDGSITMWHKLETSGDDLVSGGEETFSMDIFNNTNDIRYFRIGMPGSGNCTKHDFWWPKWVKLRNVNRPGQSIGRCHFNRTDWVGKNRGICCNGKKSKGHKCRTNWEPKGKWPTWTRKQTGRSQPYIFFPTTNQSTPHAQAMSSPPIFTKGGTVFTDG